MYPGLGALTQENLLIWNKCVAYYKLDENAANSTVVDTIGGYNGNLTKYLSSTETNRNTNTASVSGKINNGMTFKTSGSYDEAVGITIPDNNIFTFGNGTTDIPFSTSFWVYLNSWGTLSGVYVNFILNKRLNAANGSEFTVNSRYDGASQYAIACSLFSTKNTTNILSKRAIVTSGFLSAWHHIVVTYSGNSAYSGLKIYIDGSESGSYVDASAGSYVAMDNTTSNFYIGGLQNTTTRTVSTDGIIDEVGIWRSRELSARDAKTLYNLGNGRKLYK